jgi:IS4 transposase
MILSGKHRKKRTDFTRERKIGFKGILVSILISLKHSLALEIDDFIKKLDVDESLEYTGSAYSKARQKLLPSAFIELNDITLDEVYSNTFKTFKDFRLIAIDGSSVELPNTKNLKEIYGVFSKKNDYPAAKICVAYDLLNEKILNGKLFPYSGSEKAVAPELVSTLYPSSANDIVVYDRGFPSTKLILEHIRLKKKFIFRVQKGFLKEVDGFRESTELDQTITINITKRRIATNKMTEITEPVEFNLRCVRIKLQTEDEILITNLTPNDVTLEDLKYLYNCRWGIETNYDYVKNVLELENFTGDTDIAVQQDFYATIYITNLATLFIKDAQAEYDKEKGDKPKKYDYKINTTMAMSYLKRELLHVLLQDNPEKALKLYNCFIKKLTKHVIPIRKGRKFPRPTRHKPKYGRTNKKAL